MLFLLFSGESQQHGDDCGYSYISLGRLHPYGSGSGSSSGSGRRRTRRGLSDSPTAPTTPTSASDNASDATLTDSELPLARDSTLLVQNG
ncbi:putative odd Oz protein [Danaus plexippus plexippus]|uniref:Odd Oz protein n=1 Tax=Danaus plexippus plexippus TaxID=278856 RepID=A0A212FFE4_DANPL|nr:putative odd Oz protein [Danaus plexippus plexippus]